jgi:ABC-type transporter Mla MlaB component
LFKFEDDALMLRIGINHDPAELRLTLEGELTEPWIEELKAVWENECLQCQSTRRVIDLEDVTRVDESGKRILASMKDGGAQLFATGVSMKHLIRGLRKKA